MKTLTVKQPWASLIVEGIKDIENRTWKCPEKYIGQRVLIHAGREGDYLGIKRIESCEILNQEYLRLWSDGRTLLHTGAIIGSVEIVGCTSKVYDSIRDTKSIWAEQGAWHWILANPIKFPEPIPAKGKLSFWEFDLKCPEFAHFGASYPDARCIEGFLWDLDSSDGEYLTAGGEDPCPYCNPNEYLECYGKI